MKQTEKEKSSGERQRLTAVFVEQLTLPAKGQRDYHDTEIPGFRLRVSYGGTKAWIYWYRIDGRPRRLTLGRWPHMTLAEARADAREAYLSVKRGIDPAEARKSARRESERSRAATFGGLWGTFWKDHESKKVDAQNTAYTVERHVLPKWQDMPLDTIDRAEVRKLVRGPKTNGAQNNVFKTVRRIFAWGVNEGLIDATPMMGLKLPHQPAARVDRLETPEHIRTFWGICEGWGYATGHALQLLLLTGQRMQQVFKAEKGELDFDAGVWTIPAKRVKRTRPGQPRIPHKVPLTPMSAEIFRKCAGISSTRYVFTSRRKRGAAIENPQAITAELQAAIPGFTIHGLRRTMATTMRQQLGISGEIIEQVLNHRPRTVTDKHYAQGHDEAGKRRALEAWDGYLQEVLK